MKKNLLSLFVCLMAVATQMSATIHLINQQGLTFSPDNLTVLVGDTVRFRWNSGTHNTVSTEVPEGASTWNSPLNSGNQSYEYEVTVAGNYEYHCSFHSGQDGVFTAVSNPTNLNSVKSAISEMNVRVAASGSLVINMLNASGNRVNVTMLDLTGREVANLYQGTVASDDFTVRQDVTAFQRGIYFVRFQEGARVTTRKVLVQ
jgi:plastocyanin